MNHLRYIYNVLTIGHLVRVLLISSVLLGSYSFGHGQCNNSTSYGGGIAPSSGNTLTISTCNYAGEYAPITSVASATTYITGSSVNTDYITVRTGTPGGSVVASGIQPLTWTSTIAGTYYIHFNTSAACGSNTNCRTTTLSAPNTPMSFSSCTVTQPNTGDITKCSLPDKEIIRVEVNTSGALTPLQASQVILRTNGSTSPLTDISNIDVFYTANSPIFNTSNLFGSVATAAAGSNIIVNGNQSLASGANYFWVAYDITGTAMIGNALDARCQRVTISGSNYTPTVVNPSGDRTIVPCPPSPGGVDSSILLWLRPEVGVTTSGANVTGWTDQSSASTGVTVYGSPDLVPIGKNYNPYLLFTYSNGVDGGDYLKSSNQNVRSFFTAAQLNDVTRSSTHMVTYDGVTLSQPCAACAIHGGENGGYLAQYNEWGYGNGNFQATGVWRRNGSSTGVSHTTVHSGNFDIVGALGTGTGSANSYFGGQNNNLPGFNGRTRDWYGPVGELILYSGPITATEAGRIESYLAIKYGITLGGDGASGVGYSSSNGNSIWDANSGYHNDVIAIGNDTNTALLQKQSRTEDDSTRVYIGALAASNALNSGAFSSDGAYLVLGHNSGKLCATVGSSLDMPLTINSRLEREWKVVNTAMSDVFNIEVNLNICADPNMVDPDHLRLLVDEDGLFTDANIYDATSGLTFSYSSGRIVIYGISNSILPQNATRYFTIASIDPNTPLPIELSWFNAHCVDGQIALQWSTASESNNSFYTIERSEDGDQFEVLVSLPGAGNSSSILHYSYIDLSLNTGPTYYRLKQTDFNGAFSYTDIISVECGLSLDIQLYPNPATDMVFFSHSTAVGDELVLEVMDPNGRLMSKTDYYNSNAGIKRERLDISGLSNGLYFLRFTDHRMNKVFRLSIVDE